MQTTVGQRILLILPSRPFHGTNASKIQVVTPAVSVLPRPKYRREEVCRTSFSRPPGVCREDSGRNTSTHLPAEGADSDLVAGGWSAGGLPRRHSLRSRMTITPSRVSAALVQICMDRFMIGLPVNCFTSPLSAMLRVPNISVYFSVSSCIVPRISWAIGAMMN